MRALFRDFNIRSRHQFCINCVIVIIDTVPLVILNAFPILYDFTIFTKIFTSRQEYFSKNLFGNSFQIQADATIGINSIILSVDDFKVYIIRLILLLINLNSTLCFLIFWIDINAMQDNDKRIILDSSNSKKLL